MLRYFRIVAWTGGAMLALWLGSVSVSAIAQGFPDKPIKLINTFPPGGASEQGARLVAHKMSEGLGQQVVVETRTGAGGVVGNAYVAKSAPDGHTLLLVTGAMVTQAATMRKLPYDTIRDFSPISLLLRYPIVIAVAPHSKFKTLEELVAHAKNNPGKLSYGAPIGTYYHVMPELFATLAGIELMAVPYRGGFELIAETMAGRLDLTFQAITAVTGLIASGKLRPLAVTSAQPSPLLPDVPPVAKLLPGFESITFMAISGPGGLPRPIVDRLNAEIRRVVVLPDIRQRFAEWGGEASPTSPEEMQRFMESEIVRWKRVAEQKKIVVD